MSIGALERYGSLRSSPSDSPTPRTPVMGYVRSLRRTGPCGSELQVLMADRTTATVRVPVAADPRALLSEIPSTHQPLAVRIELHGDIGEEELACSCLMATPTGPERVPMSPSAALALFERGRHTLLILGPYHRRERTNSSIQTRQITIGEDKWALKNHDD